MEKTPNIALFQSPGMGHLIPIVEFAKRILSHHNISSTIIVPTDGPISSSQNIFLQKLPQGVNYILLPPAKLDDLDDARPETRISLTISRSLDSLRDTLKSLVVTTKLVALVLDFFGTDAYEVAREFNIPVYLFWSSNALSLAFMNHLPDLDAKVKCEYRELSEPIRIPGCVLLHGKDLLDPIQDRKNEGYEWMLRHAKKFKLADGIIINTFHDLEGKTLEAVQDFDLLEDPGQRMPCLYPIGPLVQTHPSPDGVNGFGCLSWLDNQPTSSVLFVSFGSGGTLSFKQVTELALGLEASGQRFIWVVRSPNDKANAAYFGDKNQDNPLGFLPEGFLERIQDRGMLVPSWAPQAAILSHAATGGFLTHCGWNSTLESVVNGVPLIAWPLYAEQKMNAVLLTDDLKVALRPRANETGLVKREEIANVVRNLMEGEEGQLIRNRMRSLKDASANVLSENGVSTKTLGKLASQWKYKADSQGKKYVLGV